MLKQRVVTAIVLVSLFLLALFGLAPEKFALVMGLVMVVAAWEWSHLAGFSSRVNRAVYAAGTLVVLVLVATWLALDENSLSDKQVRTFLAWSGGWWALALLWVQSYPSSALLWGRRWLRGVMGLVVLVPTWVAITVLVHAANGVYLVLAVVLLVALADIGAFFTGRAFGRHKLAEQVSPGKTWEGFAGGMCAIALVLIPYVLYQTDDLAQLWAWLLLAGMTGLASVLGDLLESMVKRHRGVKDSGSILPGHGGVLDRIDSLTAALPVFTLLYALLHERLS